MRKIEEVILSNGTKLDDELKKDKPNLTGVDLRDADLSYVDLRGADLSYANLRGTDLREIKYNESTSFFALLICLSTDVLYSVEICSALIASPAINVPRI